MKKQKIITIAALVHLILLGGVLLYFTLGTIIYALSGMVNSIDLAVGFMITFFASVVFLNGLLLFFSVRNVFRPTPAERGPLQKLTLIFLVVAMTSLYVLLILLLGFETNSLTMLLLWSGILPKVLSFFRVVFALQWLACTITGSVLLCVSAKET